MLKPAIMYKEELNKKFAEVLYDERYFYYTGYAHANTLPEIKDVEERYQYAIVKDNEVIGFFAYWIFAGTDTVDRFGLFSFKSDPIIGIDVMRKMEELIKNHRRIEWRKIGGNKVERHYDRIVKRHNGNKVVLHDVCLDNEGNYRDEMIYEIVNRWFL